MPLAFGFLGHQSEGCKQGELLLVMALLGAGLGVGGGSAFGRANNLSANDGHGCG